MHLSTVTFALLSGSAMASHLAIRVPKPYSPRLVARQNGCDAIQPMLQQKGMNCCSAQGTTYTICPSEYSHCSPGDGTTWCCRPDQQDCRRKSCAQDNGGCNPDQFTCDDTQGCIPKDYNQVAQMFNNAPTTSSGQNNGQGNGQGGGQGGQDTVTSAAAAASDAVVSAAGSASAEVTEAANSASAAVVDAASTASSEASAATESASSASSAAGGASQTQPAAPAATGAASRLGGISSLVVAVMAVVFIL